MIGKTNAGAGGGHLNNTDALLRVSAPAGSIVTITKGSTAKSDHGHENAIDPNFYDYYFIIHQSHFDSKNPWTVTAALGQDSASDTIIIYLPDEYDVILQYRFMLYDNGDFYTGLGAFVGTSDSGAVGMTSFNENGNIHMKKTSGPCARWYFRDPIPFKDLGNTYGTLLHFKLKQTTGSEAGAYGSYADEFVGGVYTNHNSFGDNFGAARSNSPANFGIPAKTAIPNYTEYTVDISGLNHGTNYYLGAWAVNMETYISEIWLR